MTASRLLDPATLAGLGDLRLLARTVVEGFVAGLHLDARSGAGVEFSQYRSYQPGDDPRRVDWRVYGRSDRFYVRESEVERDVTVRFVLDASASMAHSDEELSKIDYARFLIAALAYLAHRQGDRLAFHALSDTADVSPPLPRRRPLEHLLDRLERLEPNGRWPSWDELNRRLPRSRGRELIVLVSDLYDESESIDAALAAFRALGHEVLVFRLMARNELDFTFEGDLLFEDLETGQTVRGATAMIRKDYVTRLAEDLEHWRSRMLEIGAMLAMLPIDQPLDKALREFLLRRRQLP